MVSKLIKSWVLIFYAIGVLIACNPNIDSLDPNSGPERTLVEVDGDTLFSTALWDAEAVSEIALSGGFLGAYIISVPDGAILGPHDVQLRRGGRRGNKVPFTVTQPQPFGSPQVDRVSLVYAQFTANNRVNTWLYVQGSNVDVGAEVLINGNVQPTVVHKAIQNDLFGVNATDLNRPIYHHLAMIVSPGEHNIGATITVRIRNSDGQSSNAVNYVLPNSESTMDSDGDDFPDVWEVNGYDADNDGTIDVDLPNLGADPYRPDIFIEVDIMQGLNNPPTAAVFQAVENAFDAAPIINPRSDNGINLHLDTSGTVPFHTLVSLTQADNTTIDRANFYTLKANNFNNDQRGRIYHYCIWADMQPGGYSGISDVEINAAGTDFSGPGDDFIVSMDNFSGSYQTIRSWAETFMHELGHNLQQRHGGEIHFAYNQTYSSIMSYSWQLRTGRNNNWRVNHPIYAPYYYGQNAVVEVGGALPATVGTVIDYSDGMCRNLNESSLNETLGLYNSNSIDWNSDGDTTDINIAVDLNGNGVTIDILRDYANWFRLVYSGPRLNGEYGN